MQLELKDTYKTIANPSEEVLLKKKLNVIFKIIELICEIEITFGKKMSKKYLAFLKLYLKFS